MDLDTLIERLEFLRQRIGGKRPVSLMIEFKGKGQWEAPLQDIAHSDRTGVILIYEDE